VFEYTILYFADSFTATLERRIVQAPVFVGAVFVLIHEDSETWSKMARLSAICHEWRVNEIRITDREVALIVTPIAAVPE
jgi:hypothetical protein